MNMTQQERDVLRNLAKINIDNKTHYVGCWQSHGWCAVERVLDAYESLVKESG
jgi:hypothetical protein